MIKPESRTLEWIDSLRAQYPYIKDASLLEKTSSALTNDVRHYTPADDAVLSTEIIEDQTLNKLNRLKKVNTEAFFYCRRLEDLG